MTAGPANVCNLCGQSNWSPWLTGVLDYLTDEHFDIVRCNQCGLMVTQPMPSDDQIDRYYPPRYRGNRHGFTGKMRVNLRAAAIESCFPPNFRGRLLDVGCGDGAFVLEMHRRGWKVCATEIDPATVQKLRATGIDAKLPQNAVREGFGGPVDAVTCWHVMEHVANPLELAKWVKTQLAGSGVFQAAVPNARCLQAGIFRRRWLHFDVPRHRFHFSPRTFRSLMNRAGFAVQRETCFAIEYDWFGAIQSALNVVCSRRNVLFEKLTASPGDRNGAGDAVISYLLCGPVAAMSLPPMLLGWVCGDGATLTLTCRAAAASGSAANP